jgi:DNA modification methylase
LFEKNLWFIRLIIQAGVQMSIYNANCFDTLPTLADNSVDLILIDPPFGITACVWDKKPDFEKLYAEFKRILKPNGVCIIFGDFKLLADLQTTSFRKHYSHQIVWNKLRTSNQLNAKKRPLQANELINVYNFGKVKYNPQYFYGWNKKKEWVFQKPTTADAHNTKDNEIVSELKPHGGNDPKYYDTRRGSGLTGKKSQNKDNEIVEKIQLHGGTQLGDNAISKRTRQERFTGADNEIVEAHKFVSDRPLQNTKNPNPLYGANLQPGKLFAQDKKVSQAKDDEIVEKIQLHGGTHPKYFKGSYSRNPLLSKVVEAAKEGNEIVSELKLSPRRENGLTGTKTNSNMAHGKDRDKKVEAAKEGNATCLYEGEYEGNGMYNKMQIPATYTDPGYRYPTTVAPFQKRIGKSLHPTEKPVHLLEWLIKSYSDEGMVVLDCFMGSGSAGEAALDTNREFIGVEMDEAFFNIAKNRLENL